MKKYVVPTVKPNTASQAANDDGDGKKPVQFATEMFDVLYTKHLHQKSKVWEDGLLEWQPTPMKLVLFPENDRTRQLDSKFVRSPPDLGPGEELRFSKFLVEIVAKRMAGKSAAAFEVKPL